MGFRCRVGDHLHLVQFLGVDPATSVRVVIDLGCSGRLLEGFLGGHRTMDAMQLTAGREREIFFFSPYFLYPFF